MKRRQFSSLMMALPAALSSCRRSASSDRERRITYWEKWTGFEEEAMDRVVEAFNARQRKRAAREPGYRPIVVERVTVSQIEHKVLVAIAGDNPPDIAGMYSHQLASYAAKGAILDLTDKLRRAGITEERFIPAYWRLGEYRDRMWAVPTSPATQALHWNQRAFVEVGLDPDVGPKTIEELDDFAERLTLWEVKPKRGRTERRSGYAKDVPPSDKRLLRAGFLPTEPFWWQWAWGYYFGGRLIRGNRVTAAEPANVRAFEWVADYSRNIGVDKLLRFRSGLGNFSTPQNPFLSGKLAMQIQGVWMYNYIQKYAPGLQWSVAPFPHPKDRPDLANATNLEMDILIIPSNSRHPQEAFEFLKYAVSQEALETLCLGQRKHTALREVSDEFRRKHPHPHVELFRNLSFSKNAFSAPKVGVYREYRREMLAAVDAIQNLSVSPRQALLEVQKRIQRSYDRELASLRRRASG